MGNMHGRMPTRGPSYKQQDKSEDRQRVAMYVDGNTLAYEGTLNSGNSPIIIDFHTDSGGRTAHYGYLINDGTGNLQVAFSNNGTTYGSWHTIKVGEQMDLSFFSIQKMQLQYVEDNADYRVLLM